MRESITLSKPPTLSELAGEGIETFPALRNHHSNLHERCFTRMEGLRERRDERERYRQQKRGVAQ